MTMRFVRIEVIPDIFGPMWESAPTMLLNLILYLHPLRQPERADTSPRGRGCALPLGELAKIFDFLLRGYQVLVLTRYYEYKF